MPLLSRSTRSLLKNVNGCPHATDDDHEIDLKTRPGGGATRNHDERALRTSTRSATSSIALQRLSRDQVLESEIRTASGIADVTSKTIQGKEAAKNSPPNSSASTREPRSSAASVFDDGMSSNRSKKKPMTKYGSQKTPNIHVPPRKKRKLQPDDAEPVHTSRPNPKGAASRFADLLGDSLDDSGEMPKITGVSTKLAALATSYQAGDTSADLIPEALMTTTSLATTTPRNKSSSRASSSRGASPLTSISTDDEAIMLNLGVDEIDMPPGLRCPMCTRVFDEHSWSNKQTDFPDLDTSLKEQRRFHRVHRIEDARMTYCERKYPSIEWGSLPRRLQQYSMNIRTMIQRPANTFYYQRFVLKLEDDKTNCVGGKARRFWRDHNQTVDLAGTGYYGPKGASIVTEFISSSFATPLSATVKADSVISECGLSVYMQLILVPEVIALLIGEDLQVQPEEARKILDESSGIGHLLHGRTRPLEDAETTDSIVEVEDSSDDPSEDDEEITDEEPEDDDDDELADSEQ